MNKEALDYFTRKNVGVWFERHGRIFPKDRQQGLIKPKANYLQQKIGKVIARFEDLDLPVRVLGLKPRQRGSTTYFCAADYCYLRRAAASGVIIGGQYSQTDEAWAMVQTYDANDDFDWGNTGEVNQKEGKWSHGSKLKKETAKDVLAGISGTYQVLHCTEVARWAQFGVANAAEVLTNILKCVPLLPGTMIILESTAEGSTGPFYERWIGAVDAEDFISGKATLHPGQYVRAFAPWFEFYDSAIRLDDTQKKEIERTLDQEPEFTGEAELIERYSAEDGGAKRLGTSAKDFDVWEQLAWRRYAIRHECKRDKEIFNRDYPHSWQTAFQKSGRLRFNQAGISALRKQSERRRSPEHGVLEESSDGRINWRRTDDYEARVTLFERPIPRARYLMAVDVMTGASQVSGRDPDLHSVFVLRAGEWGADGKWVRPCTAARIIPCRWDIDVLEQDVWKLARFYGSRIGCKIAIEMNMDRGLTELLKLRGADLYQREVFNRVDFKTTQALGFQTNVKTRAMLIDGLAGAIRELETPGDGIDIFCPHALEQLENFVQKDDGRSEASAGFHDDDVLSIALGLHLINQAKIYVPPRFGSGIPIDLRLMSSQEQQDRSLGAYS